MYKEKIGYLYILTNELYKNYICIGICTCSIEETIKRKSADILLPYELFAFLKTKKYREAKEILLYYIRNKENLNGFIKADLKEIENILQKISNLLDDAKLEIGKKRISKKLKVLGNKNYKAINEASQTEKNKADQIIKTFGIEKNKELIKGVMECIITNGGKANITRVIIPYIKSYYPNLYTKKYQENEHKFSSWINTNIRYCGYFEQYSMGTFKIKTETK